MSDEKLTEADLPNMVAYWLSGATWFKPGEKMLARISADFTRLLAERTAELRKELEETRRDRAMACQSSVKFQADLDAARDERDKLLSWRDAFDEKARECQSLQTNLFAARAELAKTKDAGPRYAKPEGPCMFLGRYECNCTLCRCNGSVDLYWRYNSGLPQVGWRRQDSRSWYFLNNSGAAIAEAWRRARELGLPCESVAQPLTESEIEASYLATLTAAMIAADVDSVTIRPDDSGVIHRDGLLAAAYDDDSASIFGSPLAALRALVKRDQSSGPDAASSQPQPRPTTPGQPERANYDTTGFYAVEPGPPGVEPPLQTEAWLNKHQHYSAGGEPLHTDLTLAMKRVAADLRAIRGEVEKIAKGEKT